MTNIIKIDNKFKIIDYNINILILNYICNEINLLKLIKYNNIDFYNKFFIFNKLIIDVKINFGNWYVSLWFIQLL